MPVDPITLTYLIGISVFAASGALLAAERGFDLVGAIFLSVAVAVGGGTMVDLLIGETPVRWLRDPAPLAVAAAAGGIVFFTASYVDRITRALDWLDAIGLAIFTPIGLEYALAHIDDPVSAGALALVGACGGGIIRDIMAQRAPVVFSGELYVTAAAAGVCTYYAALVTQLGPVTAFAACAGVTFVLRGGAMIFGLRLSPPPR